MKIHEHVDWEKRKWQPPGFVESAGRNFLGALMNTTGSLLRGTSMLMNSGESSFLPQYSNESSKPLGESVGKWLSDTGQEIQKPALPNPKWENKGLGERLFDSEYWKDPRGLTADTTSGLGSSALFYALGGGVPRLATAATSKLFSNPIVNNATKKVFGNTVADALTTTAPVTQLTNRALFELSKRGGVGKAISDFGNSKLGSALGRWAKAGTQYTATVAPFDAIANSAELIDRLREQGLSDEEIRQRMINSIYQELPADIASNFMTGALLFGKGLGLAGKNWKGRAAYGSLNIPLEMGSEYWQEGTQTGAVQNQLGLPYTKDPVTNFFKTGEMFNTPEERAGATAGAIGSMIPAIGGAAHHAAFGGREENDNRYVGEHGNGEGRYWRRQNDAVSLDGARPETLDLLDAMGKWMYERTGGLPITLSAGTNGSHAGGEYSHANGWKLDLHDGNFGAEGSLFTDDFQKGALADEFMQYWQSRGVGVNLEGLGTPNVHFDISTKGYQWKDNDGNDLAQPYYRSGFTNGGRAESESNYGGSYDPNFTQRQNDIWRVAQYASRRAKDKYNLNVPPELFYKQWVHEAGVNFDSDNAIYNNNFGGLTQVEPNGEENRQTDGGTNYYRTYASCELLPPIEA